MGESEIKDLAALLSRVELIQMVSLLACGQIDLQLLVFFPKHKILKADKGVGAVVLCEDELILHIGQVSLSLQDIGIAFLAKLLLFAGKPESLFQGFDLALDYL